MKRRDFMKTTAAVGAGVLAGIPRDAQAKGKMWEKDKHELLHPFIKEHPEAVFIKLTDVPSKKDEQLIHDTGLNLAKELFVKSPNGAKTRIAAKPNWTCNPLQNGQDVFDQSFSRSISPGYFTFPRQP